MHIPSYLKLIALEDALWHWHRGKTATGLLEQVSENNADIDLDRSVMHRMVFSAVMAFPAKLVCIILTVLHLVGFWHYFCLATFLVFTILAFVEVYLFGKEIGKRRN
jgi:hypothetical protein